MPRLRGLGREIALRTRAVVGRDPGCDVVLDDASVSRRHATIEADQKGCTVRDLSSANGTFGNGVRIGANGVRVPVGARLRFGEIELQLVADAERRRPAHVAAVALGAIALAAGLVVALRGRPSEASAASGTTPPSAALVQEAQAALEADHAEDAEAIAQRAVEADPLLEDARAVLARAKREREAARLYDDATRAPDTANALHLLARVPPEARLFARARIKAKELAGPAMRVHGEACRSEARAERWTQAASECAAALDVACQTPSSAAPDPLLALLRDSERRSGRKVPWSCPTDLAALLRDDSPRTTSVPRDALLADRYADPKIRAAISVYVEGEPSESIRALARIDSIEARSLADRIRRVEGRSREGRTAVLAADMFRADRAYADALREDAQLIPDGIESAPARQIRMALGQAHGKLGDDYFSKGQYASAFDEWRAALAAEPRDPHLLDSLARLDDLGQGFARDPGASCADLRVAAHVSGRARESVERALSRCR